MNLRDFTRTYAALWIATLLVAALTLAIPGLAHLTRSTLELSFQSSADDLHHVFTIWLRNSGTCLAPILLILAIHPWKGEFRGIFGSALLILVIGTSVAIAGAAIGAYTTRLAPYLVHMPIEWAAIALPLSLWPPALTQPIPRRSLGLAALLTIALTFLAALVEVYVTR